MKKLSQQNSLIVMLTRKKYYPVDSFLQASKVCQEFISHNDLGGSTFIGGDIIDINGHKVAYTSYNGRIWDTSGKEIPYNIASQKYY